MNEDHINTHIGDKIRSRRHALGMNQSALGKKIGVTFQQVQKYEKGHNKIVASKLFDLANKMDVPISYFFEGLNSNQIANHSIMAQEERAEFTYNEKKDTNSMRDVMTLVKLFNSITNKNTRKKLLLFLKTLANEEEN